MTADTETLTRDLEGAWAELQRAALHFGADQHRPAQLALQLAALGYAQALAKASLHAKSRGVPL